ncbi:MAG: EutN/CcmL family microcompartment protein [Candidatus Latescibacteria bacterium]|nr:EutN/CcmL family microcompartment protein [Candidatus Latescibacterota bacterium]
METGKVRGNLVLNKTLPALAGKKLRVMEEIDIRDIKKPGNLIITFDYIGCGEGQIVLYEGGPESAMAFHPDMTGSDANILAIIDDVAM